MNIRLKYLENNTILRVARYFFNAVCVSFFVIMTVTQIQMFFSNEDASSIEFKQFNLSPKDKYPTFTLVSVARSEPYLRTYILMTQQGSARKNI